MNLDDEIEHSLTWPQRYEEDVAAAFLDVKIGTLRNWRSQGRGPRWIKYLGRVLYARETLIAWRAENEVEQPSSAD